MKLIKQTRLVFVEGKSDKVYEVDLCEVGANQFVVNFRYGKRGAALKDGSKTVAPVKRDEADRVFAKLVQSKIEAGYVDETAAPVARPAAPAPRASAPPPPAPGSVPASQDPRAQKILERLSATGADRRWFRSGSRDGTTSTWPLERAIWRAGELRIREAEAPLIALIGTAQTGSDVNAGGKGMRDYCIAWALGRCGGGEASLRALTALYGDRKNPEHVRRIAAESLLLLGDATSSQEFKDHNLGQLPEVLARAARTGNPETFAAALDDFPLDRQPAVLHQLYLVDAPATRPAFLDALGKAPFKKPLFQQLRAIFKAAELRRDARVFGIFGYRLEKTNANYTQGYRASTEPYSTQTRAYLRRRIWRTLRRLGQAGDPDYARLAAGVLLPFTDADAVEPRQVGRVHWDAYAPYLAFNHILYGNSKRYELPRNRRAWRMKPPHRPGATAPPEREEAFPALWEQNPGALMQLCAESECSPVHEFAGKALLACPAFLDELEVDDVLMLLSRPYDATARVGFVIVKKRYDASRPDLTLLGALAASAHEPGRAQAFKWIDEQRTLALGDSGLLAALVLGRPADTRAFARRLLRSATLTAPVGQVLIGRLVAGLLALGETDHERALDAVQTMTATLAAHLATVSITVIRDLLAHPLAGVQELGVELLLRYDARSGLIPVDLLLAVLRSPHENVRAAGMRLLGELPEPTLATMDELLLRLSTDANADLRNASRPLVGRVAAAYPATRDRIVAGLIESLLRRKLAEDVPSHVLRLLKDDLAAGHPAIDAETVWRLLASGSPHAQELGGILLATNIDPASLAIAQIIKLASHEILSVRTAAWRMYENDISRVQADMAAAVRILDAKWPDSRQWAFAFFRRPEFAPYFTGEVLVGVIDSVRDDVQAYGRELLQRHFAEADGPRLLLQLSEHPTRAVQLFTTNYLERFASGKPERLESLVPYLTSVLSRVNQGRVAKQRVLSFLVTEGSRDEAAAAIVIPLLFRIAATISIEYRALAIEAMMAIHRAQPASSLPIAIKPVRVVTPARTAGAR
jgi:predicted DNA-binding WGR domain protein